MGTSHRIAMRAVLLFSSLLALGLCLHDSVIENVSDFNDFQVFRAEPKNREEADFLHSLRMTATHYDFWTEVRVGGVVDIMVPQEKKEELLAELEDRDIKHSLHIQNVQELIEKEKIPAAPERWQLTRMAPRHAMTWTEYHSLEDMYTYLDYIEAELDNADWFILPSANPDGYDWSRNHNRMWRKTRSDNGGIFHCKGVDANRNWGFHWNEGGSSNDKCSDTYHGPEAFSEIENVNVRDYLLARKDKLVFYNSIHSYSQLILLPWGFQQETPDDYDTMYALAMKGSEALTAVHGKNYETGCIPCMLYIASGSSADWAHGNGINFTTSMELRDTGLYGFLLPADQIIPTSEETWAFHITVIRELITPA